MNIPRRIKVRGRFVSVVNAAVFQRHQEKSPHTKTGLTQRGINKARKGMKIPTGFTLKAYHSGVPRAQNTAELMAQKSNVRARTTSRTRADLHYRVLEGTTKLDERSEVIASPEGQKKFLKAWLGSQIESGLLGNPTGIAHHVIKKRIGLLARATRRGIKKYVTLNVTHGWIPEIVFEQLTGKSFNQQGRGIMRQGEAMQLFWLKTGAIYLQYRGRRYNVTRRIEEILQ